MATISSLLDIGWIMTTISTLLGFVWLWFGMATISTLLDIGLMVWLQYPLY